MNRRTRIVHQDLSVGRSRLPIIVGAIITIAALALAAWALGWIGGGA